MRVFFVLLSLVLLLTVASYGDKEKKNQPTFVYPETEKGDQVDDYFGTKIKDPYRWLEKEGAESVKSWIKAQNQVTFDYLAKIPYREKIRSRIKEIFNYPRYSSPFRAGEYYFFYKNDGLQNQYVIYIQKGLDGEPRAFLDANKLSKDGTTRAWLAGFSKDDKYVTTGRSEGGSDWIEMRVMEVETGKELEDRLRWVKFSGAAWKGNGFYYSAYDEPEKGKELTQKQGKDQLIYEDKKHPLRYFWADVTEDERYLILYVSEGTHGNELYFKDLTGKSQDFTPVINGFKYNTSIVDSINDSFIVVTDYKAAKKSVFLVDAKNPGKDNWKTLIPEKNDTIRGMSLAGGKLFVSYLKDAHSQVFQYNLKGKMEKEIPLPALGSAYGFYGKKEDKILFYTFTSFTYPPTIYKYNVESGKSEVFRRSEVKFNPAEFTSKQVFYKSKDGTRIPMFVVHKKGLKLDGSNPVYLYGYGGFNASLTPYFGSSKILLLENGVVFALANLRGGGEYGQDWHKAGMLIKKQNVFDDFIAAAEYLIREKYTSKERLAIAGASNGGLLVGACMTQRPDLFKVALPAVGVMDMLRYHKFTVGWGWVVEYGTSDEEEHFKNLYSYSPLHNIKKGLSYPATLVTTADHDDRVVPAHSLKFIATLQEKNIGSNPVMIRVDVKSGHGASNLTKAIDKITDEYTFLFYNLGVKVK
jgi:prolyl oligopeptidase